VALAVSTEQRCDKWRHLANGIAMVSFGEKLGEKRTVLTVLRTRQCWQFVSLGRDRNRHIVDDLHNGRRPETGASNLVMVTVAFDVVGCKGDHKESKPPSPPNGARVTLRSLGRLLVTCGALALTVHATVATALQCFHYLGFFPRSWEFKDWLILSFSSKSGNPWLESHHIKA